MAKQNWISWVLFILLAIVWGTSFILMKICSEYMNGWQIGSTRIFFAGLVFFPMAIFHITKVPFKKLPLVLLSGLLGNLFPAFLFATALSKLSSSLGGILNSLTPLFVIVIGVLFFKTKIQTNKIVGVLIGFLGLVLLNLVKGSLAANDFRYVLLILAATIMYGMNVNLVGNYLKDIAGLRIATISMTFIGIIAACVMWQQNVFEMMLHDDKALKYIGVAALLGIVGSAIATALFYVLIQRSGALFASLVTYAMPIVAISWGLLAKENITAMQVGCLGLILIGVYIANRN